MHPLIQRHRAAIGELCHRHHVRRLEIFGSGARSDDFDPSRSDVDFMVEFAPEPNAPTLDTYFDLRDALAAVLGRPVDLVVAGAVHNPYVLASIDRSKELVYAA